MAADDYIDTRNTQQRYEHALARFAADTTISTHNKELITSYLRDCALGKTVRGRTKKKIGTGQLAIIINHLRIFLAHTHAELDGVTQGVMEDFILALETGTIRSRAPRWTGRHTWRPHGGALSASYQRSIKITLRKLYTWLHHGTVPALVSWFDTRQPHVETPALTEAEVALLVARARRSVDRALIQVLYDSGFRIGELLNVRLRHVRYVQYDPDDPGRACFFIRCPVSKTLPRTVALPMPATTEWLAYWLEEHPAAPRVLPDGTLDAADLDACLFPFSVARVGHTVSRLGRRVLGKRVYPHLFRHSSATYWANHLPHYRLCKRFGWSMTSSMPQHYIDQGGLDEYDTARAYQPETAPRAARAVPITYEPGASTPDYHAPHPASASDSWNQRPAPRLPVREAASGLPAALRGENPVPAAAVAARVSGEARWPQPLRPMRPPDALAHAPGLPSARPGDFTARPPPLVPLRARGPPPLDWPPDDGQGVA